MDTGTDTQEYAAQAMEAVNSIRSKKDEKKKAWSLKIAPGELSSRLRSQSVIAHARQPVAKRLRSQSKTGDAVQPDPKEGVCRFCSERFSYSSSLMHHHRNEHPESKPFVCVECGIRYEREGVQKRHAKTHEAELQITEGKPFKCGECGTGFSHKRNLQEHARDFGHDIAGEGKGRVASYVVAGRELLS